MQSKNLDLNAIKKLIENPEKALEILHNLDANFRLGLISEINVNTTEEAIERGVELISLFHERIASLGISLEEIEPGHGIGHITRDRLNAIILARELDADPRDIFVGIVAGAIHDIGVTLVERYAESKRVIRHAEAGAILLYYALSDPIFYRKTNRAERILISYAVVAHTHYLKAMDVNCEDNIVRRIEPYTDIYPDGSPILAVWFARWIDRLDINGPGFVGRHFLTLLMAHLDFDGKNFYSVTFANHMRPILRSEEEIKAQGGARTMLEHLYMFASTQNNASPYGKHDFGAMIVMRDAQTKRLKRIINAVLQNERKFDQAQKEKILTAWTAFLYSNIEPTQKASQTAINLKYEFEKLDENTQNAWLNGFIATMEEYAEWSEWILEKIKTFPAKWYSARDRNFDEAVIRSRCHWRTSIESI